MSKYWLHLKFFNTKTEIYFEYHENVKFHYNHGFNLFCFNFSYFIFRVVSWCEWISKNHDKNINVTNFKNDDSTRFNLYYIILIPKTVILEMQ